MNESTNPDTTRPGSLPGRAGRWLRRSWLKIAKGLLIALVVLAVGHGIATLILGRRYEAELNRIGAKGEPVSMSDLAKMAGQPIPDSENAAPVFRQAFSMIEEPSMARGLEALDKLVGGDREERTAETWSQAAAAAKRFGGVMRLIEEGARRPKCYFPVKWEDGASATFQHYAMLRQLARIPAAFADLAARDGKPDDALRYIGLSLRLAECTEDPVLIGLLVRIALIRFATGAVYQLIDQCNLSEAQARRAFDMLGGIDLEEQQTGALLGERAFGVWIAGVANRSGIHAALQAGSPAQRRPELTDRIGAYLSRPFTYADALCYLGLMRKEIHSAHVPFRELRSRRLDADSLEKQMPFYATMARTLAPVFPRIRMQIDACIAEIADARAALALVAYKDRFGSYPNSLREVKKTLGWDLPEDPFSGRDLIYKREGKGFIVYSIGPNLRDDGGVLTGPEEDKEKHGDIVVSRNR